MLRGVDLSGSLGPWFLPHGVFLHKASGVSVCLCRLRGNYRPVFGVVPTGDSRGRNIVPTTRGAIATQRSWRGAISRAHCWVTFVVTLKP